MELQLDIHNFQKEEMKQFNVKSNDFYTLTHGESSYGDYLIQVTNDGNTLVRRFYQNYQTYYEDLIYFMQHFNLK